jgi:predicted nucleic acid-binding protein
VMIGEAVWGRALDVWHDLLQRARHRQVKIPDLLVASAAELAGIGVCHYDADFEAIADITGQPVRAIAPLGRL